MGAAKGLTLSIVTGHPLRKLNSNLSLIKSDPQQSGEMLNGFIHTGGATLGPSRPERSFIGFKGHGVMGFVSQPSCHTWTIMTMTLNNTISANCKKRVTDVKPCDATERHKILI